LVVWPTIRVRLQSASLSHIKVNVRILASSRHGEAGWGSKCEVMEETTSWLMFFNTRSYVSSGVLGDSSKIPRTYGWTECRSLESTEHPLEAVRGGEFGCRQTRNTYVQIWKPQPNEDLHDIKDCLSWVLAFRVGTLIEIVQNDENWGLGRNDEHLL